MHDDNVFHAWFIFKLHTEISFIFTDYVTQYLQMYNNSQGRRTLALIGNLILLTWRASFFVRGDESPSTLVSGLLTTARPLTLTPFTPF